MTTELRPYGGSARQETPAHTSTAANWQGRARVKHITGLTGTLAQTPWMVELTWTGPRMDGLPPHERDGENSDMLMVANLELGREIAIRAVEQINALRVPDLRLIHRELRQRARFSATKTQEGGSDEPA